MIGGCDVLLKSRECNFLSVFRLATSILKTEITVMSLRSTFEVPESLLKNTVIILPSDRYHENIRPLYHIFCLYGTRSNWRLCDS